MSESRGELYAALAKAQGQFKGADRDATNPHFRSKYPTLQAVIEATQEALSANGLCLIQMPVNVGENIGITTILGHASGESIESMVYVAPARFDAQALGSCVTYLRRYARMAILGIAPDDDDGEAAIGRPQNPAGEPYRPPAPNGGARHSLPPARSAGTEAGQLKLSTIRDEILATIQTKTTRLEIDAYEKLCEPDLALIDDAHKPTATMLRQMFETQRQSVPSGL